MAKTDESEKIPCPWCTRLQRPGELLATGGIFLCVRCGHEIVIEVAEDDL